MPAASGTSVRGAGGATTSQFTQQPIDAGGRSIKPATHLDRRNNANFPDGARPVPNKEGSTA